MKIVFCCKSFWIYIYSMSKLIKIIKTPRNYILWLSKIWMTYSTIMCIVQMECNQIIQISHNIYPPYCSNLLFNLILFATKIQFFFISLLLLFFVDVIVVVFIIYLPSSRINNIFLYICYTNWYMAGKDFCVINRLNNIFLMVCFDYIAISSVSKKICVSFMKKNCNKN